MRKLMAAEEASMQGFFRRVIEFYERWLRRALEHPWWLLAGSRGSDHRFVPLLQRAGF